MSSLSEEDLCTIQRNEPELAKVLLEQVGLRENEWPNSNDLEIPSYRIPATVKEGKGRPEGIQERFLEKCDTQLEDSPLHNLDYFTEVLYDLVQEGYIGVIHSEDGEPCFLSVALCLEWFGEKYDIEKVDEVEEATNLPRDHIWRVAFEDRHIDINLSSGTH